MAYAQEQADSRFEVYWQSSRWMVLEGVTSVVILDEDICKAQIGQGAVTFFGLNRGETVAHIWQSDKVKTILVSVVARPAGGNAPSLQAGGGSEALGRGAVATSATISTGADGSSRMLGVHRLDWQQTADGRRVSFRGMAQNNLGSSAAAFNLASASAEIAGPRSTISMIDVSVDTGGGFRAKLPSMVTNNTLVIRGAGVSVRSGASEYQVYAGARTPGYFLSMAGMGDIAGFNFARDLSRKARVYTTTAATSVPLDDLSGRDRGYFQTAGLTYRFSNEVAFMGSGGISNRGGTATLGLAYTGQHLAVSASGILSARNFPLNRVLLYDPGATSASGAISYRLNDRFYTSIGYQRTTSAPTGFTRLAEGSTSVSPSVNIALSSRHRLALIYTLQDSRMADANGNKQRTSRYQSTLQSSFGRFSNNFQAEYSSRWNAGPSDSQRDLNLRESLTLNTKAGSFAFGVTQFQSDPSTLARAKARLGLLDPAYQQMIESDPTAFLGYNLPPAVLQLLDDFRPRGTEVSASGSFNLGRRLSLSPHMQLSLTSQGSSSNSQTHNYGYNLVLRVTPALQLQSSLNEVLMMASGISGIQKSRVLTVGLYKSFWGGPKFLIPLAQRGSITGFVYRDSDVDGVYETGEPGLSGIRVELAEGGFTLTDSHGMYTFSRLDRKVYHGEDETRPVPGAHPRHDSQ